MSSKTPENQALSANPGPIPHSAAGEAFSGGKKTLKPLFLKDLRRFKAPNSFAIFRDFG